VLRPTPNRTDHEITEDLRGWLESPSLADASTDYVVVSGWAFSRTSRIVELTAQIVDGRHTIYYGIPRRDVRAVYPSEPGADYAGFFGAVEIGGPPNPGARLEVWCTLENGQRLRLFTRRLAPHRLSRIAARVLGAGRLWFRRVLRVLRANTAPASADAGRRIAERRSRQALDDFLRNDASIRYEQHSSPRVSIVLVLWNRAELTLGCLQSISAQTELPIEVIVIDNQSTDKTSALLERVSGAVVRRNPSNLGFAAAANLGASVARGELLLFLNNDAELQPGAIQSLAATLNKSSDIGAVGGKLVFPDGQVQEAGSIVWSDGSCEGYGRTGDPAAGEFNFQRDVDYCSAALLPKNSWRVVDCAAHHAECGNRCRLFYRACHYGYRRGTCCPRWHDASQHYCGAE